MSAAGKHRVVRVSTRHGLGYCSICGQPALGFKINGKWTMRHATAAEQSARKEIPAGLDASRKVAMITANDYSGQLAGAGFQLARRDVGAEVYTDPARNVVITVRTDLGCFTVWHRDLLDETTAPLAELGDCLESYRRG